MKKYFILIFIPFFCGCGGNSLYEKFENVDVDGWEESDIKTFTFENPKQEEIVVEIFLRNTDKYPKENLWLFVTTMLPTQEVIKDTIDCPLADDYGYWLGDGFSGLYTTKHILPKEKNLKGKWTITVQQAMRQNPIPGIKEVGLVVKSIKK